MLICLEGADGVGKSTQTKLLYNALLKENLRVKLSPWNSAKYLKKIYQYLNVSKCWNPDVVLALVAGEFCERYSKEIEPALNCGEIVICDRYVLTAYTRDYLRGSSKELIDILYNYARKPDLTILLKNSPEEVIGRLMTRSNKKRIDYWDSGLESYLKIPVCEAYRLYQGEKIGQEVILKSTLWFIENIQKLYESYQGEWIMEVIDCSGLAIEEIHSRILTIVLSKLEDYNTL